MKRVERQKIAEINRMNRGATEIDMNSEKERILQEMQESDNVVEKERDRQMANMQAKLLVAKNPIKNGQDVVNQILENYNDSVMA